MPSSAHTPESHATVLAIALTLLLSESRLTEAEKSSILESIPLLSFDEIFQIIEVLEAEFVSNKTALLDQKLEQSLEKLSSMHSKKDGEIDDLTTEQLLALAHELE